MLKFPIPRERMEEITLDAFPDLSIFRENKERSSYIPAEWPENYLSASAIKQLYRCPEQFRQRRILGKKEAPAAALTIGGAHHKGVEHNREQKITTHSDLPVANVQAAALNAIEEEVGKKGGPGEYPDWRDNPTKGYDDARSMVEALAKKYHVDRAPMIQPHAVEQPFMIEIPGLPIPITGFIDCVGDVTFPLLLGETKPVVVPSIIENKTAGRDSVSNENKLQGYTYQLVHRLPVRFDLSLKQKTPKLSIDKPANVLQVAPEQRTVALIHRSILSLAHFFSVYGPDEPWPGAFGGFADTCGYCGFRPQCPWWTEAEWGGLF